MLVGDRRSRRARGGQGRGPCARDRGEPRRVNRGRRPLRRVAADLRADRNAPPLDLLEREEDPERFRWRMLPHAARTFSLAIAVLPDRLARTIGVAYLGCRILDTVEDLARDAGERDR